MRTALAITAVCGTLVLQYVGQEQSPVTTIASIPGGLKAPLVIPQPKSLRLGLGEFRVLPSANWVLRAAARDERLWLAAQSAFACKPGSFEQTDQPWIALVFGGSSRTTFPTGQPQPRWASDPEGYQLTVETNGLVIMAPTAQGVFYGLQSLAQLWRESPSGRFCPALEIADWPAMRFRCVHWFPSASGVPMHQQLITNVFGALKFNRSIIQCEAARWDKHPEITAPNAISKPDLRKLVEACRQCYLDPIPLLNPARRRLPRGGGALLRAGEHLHSLPGRLIRRSRGFPANDMDGLFP